MAADPQHLIALSLSKIAMARNQRGGLNLHRNLLVASVLHKARTRYVKESYQYITVETKVPQETEHTLSLPTVPASLHSSSLNYDSDVESDHDMFKENNPPVLINGYSYGTTMNNDSDISQLTASERKCDADSNVRVDNYESENSQRTTNDVITPLSPGKSALKRRLSRQSISNHEPLKQCRLGTKIAVKDSLCEAMQTEPQIASIISLFNTELSGLCGDGSISCSTEVEFSELSSQSYELCLPLSSPIALAV